MHISELVLWIKPLQNRLKCNGSQYEDFLGLGNNFGNNNPFRISCILFFLIKFLSQRHRLINGYMFFLFNLCIKALVITHLLDIIIDKDLFNPYNLDKSQSPRSIEITGQLVSASCLFGIIGWMVHEVFDVIIKKKVL